MNLRRLEEEAELGACLRPLPSPRRAQRGAPQAPARASGVSHSPSSLYSGNPPSPPPVPQRTMRSHGACPFRHSCDVNGSRCHVACGKA
ncbi:hypothetical protein NDU88_002084 [Pleurodeles waltl]|uniref:Uncharacterized protein n=1 Tax=Pleurodeles waltl TaxID=8319 RepID=A0AAV7SDX3_PLEWA|nr:hypothetical protein NDU88_002084 [Pleurodeles waltl]